jgi:histidinol-phosphate/aromatic aminotransferase/cobyric acid decarboxylase-like protein
MLTTEGAPGDDVLMDWNESPLGPPPTAVARVVDVAGQLHRYPRGLMAEVSSLAARRLGVSTDQLLLTAGVDEAVDITLSLAQCGWGVQPGFDGYPDRVTANGKPFHWMLLGPDWQPVEPMPSLGEGDIVFLAQPSNPTGNLYPADWIRRVRAAAQYVLIDETYQEFSSRPSALSDDSRDPGLLVYRSFSKAMGLAGIRVGGLVGAPEVIAWLRPRRRFMPIDAISLSAAAGVLTEPGYVKRLVEHVAAARPMLAGMLRDSGLFHEVRDTDANFVMAQLRPDTAEKVMNTLARHRIWVKRCEALGLADWIRVSVGTWEDQRRFGECLASVPTSSVRAATAATERPARIGRGATPARGRTTDEADT